MCVCVLVHYFIIMKVDEMILYMYQLRHTHTLTSNVVESFKVC